MTVLILKRGLLHWPAHGQFLLHKNVGNGLNWNVNDDCIFCCCTDIVYALVFSIHFTLASGFVLALH